MELTSQRATFNIDDNSEELNQNDAVTFHISVGSR